MRFWHFFFYFSVSCSRSFLGGKPDKDFRVKVLENLLLHQIACARVFIHRPYMRCTADVGKYYLGKYLTTVVLTGYNFPVRFEFYLLGFLGFLRGKIFLRFSNFLFLIYILGAGAFRSVAIVIALRERSRFIKCWIMWSSIKSNSSTDSGKIIRNR